MGFKPKAFSSWEMFGAQGRTIYELRRSITADRLTPLDQALTRASREYAHNICGHTFVKMLNADFKN